MKVTRSSVISKTIHHNGSYLLLFGKREYFNHRPPIGAASYTFEIK